MELRQMAGQSADNPLGILLAICNATPDIVVTFTAEGQPTFLNDAGRRFCALEAETPLDQSLLDTVFPAWTWRLMEERGFPEAAANGMWKAETAVLASRARSR